MTASRRGTACRRSRSPAARDPRDYLACNRFDVRDWLAGIRTPTLVVTGAEDRLTPLRYGRFLAETIPGARLLEISGAGHFPQLEQPAALNLALREFLADLRAASPGGLAGAGVERCP